MANLETLELTINANAESASQGLSNLINSLSSLGKAIGKNVGGLKLLNSELAKLKKTGTIKMPNLSNATGASRAVSASQRQAQAIEEWKRNRKPLTVSHFRDNVWTEEQERAANPQWFNNYESPEWKAKIESNKALNEKNAEVEKAFNETSASADKLSGSLKNVADAAEIPVTKLDALKMKLDGLDQAMDKAASKGDTLAVANRRLAMFSTADKIEKETEALNSSAKNTGFFANALEKAKESLSGLGKSFSRIGRIASTMLIRTALRSLIKAFQNAWSSAYEFSKHMGGQFAESVDKAKTLLAGVATSVISTFSPAISALLPVIQSVVGAIQYLCKAIQWLFSLLGMSNELFGASTDAINAYSGASGGASKANKEMLASFDELNVISQETGGGGGGGGGGASYKNGMFSDIVSDEMAKIQLIVSESLLALGLILACTGHFGLGIGLMAIGAAGIAKTVIADWGALSKEMQGELATIMTIVGAATLALGAILAFSGANIPLGIGLMAIGAANLAAVAYVNFTNGLPDEVKKTITTILGIVGGALLAVGAILAFSGANIPLGIGLMIAGGLSLGTAVALNWNSLTGTIKSVFKTLCDFLVGVWDDVVEAINNAWDAVKKWWEDSGVGPAFRQNWSFIKQTFKSIFDNVVKYATGAWDSIKKWWEDSGVGAGVRRIWGGVSSFFRGLWDNISEWAQAAWSGVSQWWHTNVTSKIEKGGIWGGVAGFFSGLWDSISTAAKGAWDVVKDWWEKSGVGQWVRRTWDDVSHFFVDNVWGSIKRNATSAWDTVKKWWESTGISQWVSRAWSDVGNFLKNSIWTPIKNAVSSAWDAVTKWWEESGVGEKVRSVWSTVGVFLKDTIWNPVKGAAQSAWNTVKQWWEKTGIGDAVRAAWDGVVSVFNEIKQVINDIVEGINKITGTHTVEIVQNIVTQGTPENNLATSTKNLINTNAKKSGNIFEKAFSTVTNFVGNLFGFAEGGFPTSGDLFIANENSAEMIGSLNGRTAVVNNDQIVDGISRGVSEGQAEQNMLLREQNNLLRGILEKETSVKIGASAMFGREIKRSLDMYTAVGG